MKINTGAWIVLGIVFAATYGPGQKTDKELTDSAVHDMISLTMMPPTWQKQMRVYVANEYGVDFEGRE